MNGYTPRIDDLVWDEATRKVGQVMGHVGPSWQLRPPGGGRVGREHSSAARDGGGEPVGGRGAGQRPKPGRAAVSAATATDDVTLSAECTLGQRPDYRDLHRECRQTKDVPLPHSSGILLVRRCGCACHRRGGAS